MTTENTLTNEEKLAWERNPAKRLTLTDAPIPFEPKLIRVSWPRSVTVLDVEGNDVTQRLEDDGILFSINVKPVEEATANALFEQTEITFTSFPNEAYGNGVYNIEKSNDGENWELVAVVEPTEKNRLDARSGDGALLARFAESSRNVGRIRRRDNGFRR